MNFMVFFVLNYVKNDVSVNSGVFFSVLNLIYWFKLF